MAVLSSTQEIVKPRSGDCSTIFHNFSLNIYFLPGMKAYSYSLESHHCMGKMTQVIGRVQVSGVRNK